MTKHRSHIHSVNNFKLSTQRQAESRSCLLTWSKYTQIAATLCLSNSHSRSCVLGTEAGSIETGQVSVAKSKGKQRNSPRRPLRHRWLSLSLRLWHPNKSLGS